MLRVLLYSLLLLFFATSSSAQRAELESVPSSVRVPMMAGRYEAALEELDRLDESSPQAAGFWAYLRGSALAHLGRDEDAAAELKRAEMEFPSSRWRVKARFQRAEVLRRLSRFEEAEGIYESGARELRAEGRQREMAKIYLEFADALSTPPTTPSPADELDYARAGALYEKLLELDAPRDLVDRAEYRRAFCAEKNGDLAGATRLYREYLADFDASEVDSLAAREGAGRHVIEARLALGRTLLASGNSTEARRQLEDVAATWSMMRERSGGWGDAVDALAPQDVARIEELTGEAAYEIADTWNSTSQSEGPLRIAALRRFLAAHPQHARAARAASAIAETYQQLERLEDALVAYEEVLARPTPAGDAAIEAARLAQRALFQKGQILVSQRRFDEGIEAFETYTRTHANGPDWSSAQHAIVEAEYARCLDLRRDKRWSEARESLGRFLESYPLDGRARQIYFDVGQLYFDEALAGKEAKLDAAEIRRAFEAAVAHWSTLVAKFPGTDEASSALFHMGSTQATQLGDLEAAIDSYRQCTFGAWASSALQALTTMTEPTLGVRTERVWRSNESAKIHAFVRNTPKLDVEIYALDLEAYFRKHLTHESIEGLDLDLIAPDQRFEVEVEGYERFAGIEQAIELPVEGPGVWAVAISSEERRATTLVIRSDVEVIVKSSQREVFVYAQDMLADRPAEGVSVLIGLPAAGGATPLFRELQTSAEGIARLELPELAEESDLRLLAFHDGHFASDGLDLTNLGLQSTLQPRAFVYTDRTAYRPGEVVHWRAILRGVEDGNFRVQAGESYAYEVFDSRGRVLDEGAVSASEYGTVHGELLLDELCPLGSYSIKLRDRDGGQFRGYFQVEQFRLQRVELELEFDQEVYYRGEVVELTARAAYYYGEPVVDSALRISLPDGRDEVLRTDARGEAHLRFETRDMPSERLLGFSASLTDEGVSQRGVVRLAVSGYTAGISTARELYLAGDQFTVDVRTTTPDGEGSAQSLTLSVLYQEQQANGTKGETLHARHEVQTDDDGRASVPLQLDRGGWYTLRAEGLDRFGNPVVSSHVVFISGDEDETRLRVLADADRAKVGEEVRLDVHNRAGAGLALFTIESERVLEYRVLRLDEGHNEVVVEIGMEHFPNVNVSASMMLGNKFFRADTELLLERSLEVRVAPAREEYAPGEEVEVRVEVTDALGRPVQAELSLAVVDEALFELFPYELPDVALLLQPERRKWAAMRTGSSCGFSYRGELQEISLAVLEDRKERASADRERARRAQTLAGLGYLDKAPALDAPAAPAILQLGQPQEELEELFDAEAWNDAIGIGGGAGGKFGGRFGGKRNLRASGGRGDQERPSLDAESAFWAPAIVTGKDGLATVSFRLPERSTRWRLTCVGADRGTQVGEARASLTSRAEFFLELLLPEALVEGDSPKLRARVHARGESAQDLQLELAAGEFQDTLSVKHAGVAEYSFGTLPAVKRGALELVARATLANGRVYETREALEVRPWGLERSAAASGRLTGETMAPLTLPAGDYSGTRLSIQVDRDVNRSLARIALGGSIARWSSKQVLLSSDAAELSGVVSVIELFRANGRSGDPQLVQLRARAEALLARLLASQSERGGWSLSGTATRNGDHTETSCIALAAIARARALGLTVPALATDSARSYLAERFRQAAPEDDELKAMIVHALAVSGQDDFSTANRLHRMRNSLSPAALAYTARALVEMNRAPMAAEVAAVLAERVEQPTPQTCRWDTERNRGWDRPGDAMTALALCALVEAAPASQWIAPAARELEGRAPWAPGRTRGLALEALSKVGGAWSAENERARVKLFVDGEQEHTFELRELASDGRFDLELPDGPARPVTVRLALEGRGEPHWTATLSGFSSEVAEVRDREFGISSARYLAAPPVYRGRAIGTGFGVLTQIKGEDYWVNEVKSIAPGERFDVGISFGYVYPAHDAQQPGDYFMLDVPLPAGARVLEGSVSGNHESFVQRPGLLTLSYPQLQSGAQVNFTMVGATTGEYRALPPVLRHSFDPSRVAIGEPLSLKVLERGEVSDDLYRPTPDELYHLGTAMYQHQEFAGAAERLTALYDQYRDDLRAERLRELAEMLLFLGIRSGDHQATVRYFEVLKEKNPELFIPFDDVIAVGRAYRELQEFERALLIFKATIDETFGKDLKVAGTLAEQGEFAGSVDTLERLWLEYPDSAAVVETYLALADKVLTKAPEASSDKSLRAAGRDRYALAMQGILALQRFLALYPTSPLAPDAGLNLISAYLGLESYEDVSRLGGEMAEIYTAPRYRDAFAYSRAVAEWHLSHDDVAQEQLVHIAESSYVDEAGVQRHSLNRELSYYILAQIFHARREFGRAAEYYELIRDDFSDAVEVLEAFREKRVSLPEVTTSKIGAATELELTHKNLERAELLVYSVDLMTLYLRERNLSKVTQVNLAGISPTLRREVKLERGGVLEVETTRVSLDLEKPGAYLVICRGDELHTSGLVLVSDFDLEVREDPTSGRVRVTALDRDSRAFLRGVDVRVVGSESSEFQRGKSDPRGLFIADGVSGVATVIAQREDQYAFYRGSSALGARQQRQEELFFGLQNDTQSYFKNVVEFNGDNMIQRGAKLEEQIQRKRKGVQVLQVK